MIVDHDLAREAARYVASRVGDFRPRWVVALGSGLGDACVGLDRIAEWSFGEIPGFSAPTVVGHAGKLVAGWWSGAPVLTLLGRMHLYEGHSMAQAVHPIAAAHALGARAALLTNMSGGVEPSWAPPTLAAIRDHLDVQHGLPRLRRAGEGGPYSPRLLARLHQAAERADVTMREGVYAAMLGPNYETPAEIRCLRTLGCQMVGMSTAPEANAAAALGMEVCGISCIANYGAGVVEQRIDHADVVAAARAVVRPLGRVLSEFFGTDADATT
jgi:purine-nucleoside phosphorylase